VARGEIVEDRGPEQAAQLVAGHGQPVRDPAARFELREPELETKPDRELVVPSCLGSLGCRL
jgi:hypothetical protein